VAPLIPRLSIARFRGISALTRWPGPGLLNLILGSWDVGKTTILDAIVQRISLAVEPPQAELYRHLGP
jgi:hypothetical protein